MNTLHRRLALCLLTALALAFVPKLFTLAASVQPVSAQVAVQKVAVHKSAAAPNFSVLAAPAKTSPKPPSLGASVQGPVITVPDPKRPGKLQIMVHAREIHGASTSGGFGGTLINPYAQLYQLGVPSAILTAPTAVASSRQGTVIVTATGGVLAKSLTHPGTTLTADKMVWYAGQNKIVATGHVVYKDGKTGARLTGPSMKADTQMQTVSMESGQASAHL